MPGLVPGIFVFASPDWKDVDGRDEPGHDETVRKSGLSNRYSTSHNPWDYPEER
jgi:hypothetical protein